jgi:hypothetical protein
MSLRRSLKMASKGKRVKRAGDGKRAVARHTSHGTKAGANACEKAIETGERRLGRSEIDEQLADMAEARAAEAAE